ncbi:putative protein IDA [Helianthus annuus]|uniref:Protein IDA-LIKE 2 n=1 Tax=Helianthus annuus TaxID=4232 RepID=A0A9K3HWN8_HELAN|nr:putative protein IDA [Helianthus annuus]KAJ0520922.1 putative protein IDA [Helianthus annuus]KAJ0878767.1 putative protein IDA [Helianthus annuus]KAJ0882976.1 putative protein IDA [Helianthus annuus]
MNLVPWRSSLVLITIFFFFIVAQTESSRTTSSDHVFRVTGPNSRYSGHFFGFLPKRKTPLPVSGPSRKHNDIGPQSWRLP